MDHSLRKFGYGVSGTPTARDRDADLVGTRGDERVAEELKKGMTTEAVGKPANARPDINDQNADIGKWSLRLLAAGIILMVSLLAYMGHVEGIIGWSILGLIAGFIGSKIGDKKGQWLWLNIALGTVGALVGGFLFSLSGGGAYGLSLFSLLVPIIGSIVALLIYNTVAGHHSA
jgi:uncharacterized membrane protein YeaQ/YmgE (transglycosylase-associated protein family)